MEKFIEPLDKTFKNKSKKVYMSFLLIIIFDMSGCYGSYMIYRITWSSYLRGKKHIKNKFFSEVQKYAISYIG